MTQVRSYTHYHPDVLTHRINKMVRQCEEAGETVVSVTFGVAPWTIDGEAGANYTAFILVDLPDATNT